MYCKTIVLYAALLYVVRALPQHGSHGAQVHGVVHAIQVHEHHEPHHDAHHAVHHAPAVSSQSLLIHNSGGHHVSSHGKGGHHEHEGEHYGHPKYVFEYKVEDPHTGDKKYQKESRDGDKVEGLYHLVEADGRLRTVKYHADKHSGFNAEVTHSGHAVHVEQPKHHYHH